MIEGSSVKEKSRSNGKHTLTPFQRRCIWRAIQKAADKLDWKSISDESGIDVTKLKRHLRDVLSKDVERMLA